MNLLREAALVLTPPLALLIAIIYAVLGEFDNASFYMSAAVFALLLNREFPL